jgi:hypothetical protein
MLAVGVVLAPKAQAADLGFDEYSGGGGYYDEYSGGSGYYDQYSGGNGYFDQYSGGNGYFDEYSGGNPSYDSGYGGGFSGGCGSTCGGGFSGSGFGGFGGFGGGSGGSVFAPSTATANTSIYAPTNTNTCTAPNTCNTSYDDHSIFNAPTTVTIAGGGSSNSSYPVYIPVQQPSYPVYNTPCYTCQTPIYQNPVRQPYVSLSAAPYTGLDLGPVGTALYWGFLAAWCLLAAYLIVYKRVQTSLVSGLNSFLFGAPATAGTHAKVVMPASTSAHKAYVAPAAHNDDAIDPFIASQISRNK